MKPMAKKGGVVEYCKFKGLFCKKSQKKCVWTVRVEDCPTQLKNQLASQRAELAACGL